MALVEMSQLEFADRPFFLPQILRQVPFIEGSQPVSAIRPLENLRNRYYANSAVLSGMFPSQSQNIARTNPPVKAATSPVTLNATGMGSTYRLSDEALRQYSLGSYLQNSGMTYYQTRP